MSIQEWSENITVAELSDDPQFSDDLAALLEALEEKPASVVLNFATVTFINSSNIATINRALLFLFVKLSFCNGISVFVSSVSCV